jgi:hypothetical protein
MKNTRLVIVIALCVHATSPAATRLLIGQGFERETWPPPGWRIKTRTPPVAYWARVCTEGNCFARGFVGGSYGGAVATLITKKLELPARSKIAVAFDYTSFEEGYPYVIKRKVYLVKGDYENIWSLDLQIGAWKRVKANIPPIKEAGDDYTFRWCVEAVTFSGTYVVLCIDNIRIKETNTAVEPTSLGRVRALYR